MSGQQMVGLGCRANILVKHFRGKPVVIYEDHRTILNVINHAFKNGVLTKPPTLVYFDRHCDSAELNPARPEMINNLYKILKNNIEERALWDFVEWELTENDADWLIPGLELGLIKNALLIGGERGPLVDKCYALHADKTGAQHHLHSLSHIWSALDRHDGWLFDVSQKQKFSPIWNILGLDHIEGDLVFKPDREEINPIILDFDLDCFTSNGPNGKFAWPFRTFNKAFTKGTDSKYTAKSFLKELIDHCELITIARESDYCGGIEEANIIFENLNKVIFNGELY